MKRLFFGIILILLLMATTDIPEARVTGVCSNCHTMHNSQAGQAMAVGGTGAGWNNVGNWVGTPQATPNETLLIADCVGCHTSTSDKTIIERGGSRIPIVYNTVPPAVPLAGGNFYWVTQTASYGNAYGHNVLGIADADTLTEAPGNVNDCASSCHCSLATTGYNSPGCCGCHLNPAHHADDTGPIVGTASPSTDGYFRFLSGHMSGNNHGVCGIENPNWNYGADKDNHNEYLGWSGDKEYAAGFYNLGHTMTAFCSGCHGNFHVEQDSSGNWLRHPSDAVIPNSGEYASAFGASHFYDSTIPVARPILTAVTDTVAIGTDLVMCLSCHRPHGSPYYKLMRWDYKNWPGGGDDGCSTCHTSKN